MTKLHNSITPIIASGLLLFSTASFAQPDLQITSMQISQPREGNCNTVRMTVRNAGNQFTDEATIDIFLATFPAASPNQNRAEKSLFISPLQPGRQVSFNITNVEFKTQGAMRMQGLVDSTQEIAESNENNNTRIQNVSVNGSCGGGAAPTKPLTRAGQGCDLEIAFTQPGGSTISANQDNAIQLRAKNVGSARCDSVKFRLYRYNNGSASGYGSAVGGTRNIKVINELDPGQQQLFDFTDNPKAKGTFSYAPKTLSPWNDENNNNHRPKKAVNAQ